MEGERKLSRLFWFFEEKVNFDIMLQIEVIMVIQYNYQMGLVSVGLMCS